ncbi:MAG: hypothetical protein V3S98_08115 [Dehalococcoidia bacterium]
MPSTTTIKQIVEDLNDRKSEIARKFDKCSKDAKCRAIILPLIKAPAWDPSTQPLPDGVVKALHLTTEEAAHINAWPDRALVRDKVVAAITGDQEMEFFWDLNDDPSATESYSDIDPPGAPPPLKVTFLTPRGNVTKPGLTYGNIKVTI